MPQPIVGPGDVIEVGLCSGPRLMVVVGKLSEVWFEEEFQGPAFENDVVTMDLSGGTWPASWNEQAQEWTV